MKYADVAGPLGSAWTFVKWQGFLAEVHSPTSHSGDHSCNLRLRCRPGPLDGLVLGWMVRRSRPSTARPPKSIRARSSLE